ncbi:hypothetical protein SSZBM1_47 [Synechococcus phage S-SZBM1]|uniref:Uncharacterized protein n=1 Tax=Synechococcus phage S-SZBM1 TaxID=2926475 RepID=A0AC61TSG6_9CAUD|nr:hypothetical protein PP650_gp047 [Synechococcus phage S-SZBM1]UNH61164.1 hypothetical protein SSZBM1_47 [Synechococcus phage S-SZBM1]
MAKRALVRADGFITDICEAGEEFEVYTGPGSSLKWMDIPDDATNLWKMELGEWIPDYSFHDPETLRIVAYGDPGAQLSMLYRDIEAGLFGEKAKKGKFFQHIKSVKETLPEVEWEEIEVVNDDGTTSIVRQKVLPNEPFPHTDQIPCWLGEFEIPDDAQKEFGIGRYGKNVPNVPTGLTEKE